MLQVTESAAATLAATRSRIGIPDHFGLRIFRGQTDGGSAFAFHFVEEPQEGDEVGETEQTRYFVAPRSRDRSPTRCSTRNRTPRGRS